MLTTFNSTIAGGMSCLLSFKSVFSIKCDKTAKMDAWMALSNIRIYEFTIYCLDVFLKSLTQFILIVLHIHL